MVKLVDEWSWVARKAWSVRFIALAAILTGADAVAPYFIPKYPSAVMTLAALGLNIAALVARFVAQRRDKEK